MSKQFNLELAKQGRPVETKCGLKAKIIDFCYRPTKGHELGLAVKVYNDFDEENIIYFNYDGTCPSDPSNNLMMISIKVQLWQNIYKYEDGSFETGFLYDSEEECKQGIEECHRKYITTVKIEFEN